MTQEDAQFALELAAGEAGAVEVLLGRYWERGYRIALGLTGDPATAEDAVQEAVVAALRRAQTYRSDRGPFRSWFFRIVENRAKDQRRAASRRRRHEGRADPRSSREEGLGSDEAAQVLAALASLPPDLRAAVTLRCIEGMTYREVGEAMGWPEGTATTRVKRGLKQLRQKLEERDWAPAALAPAALAQLLRGSATSVPAAPAVAEVLAAASVAPAALAAKGPLWALALLIAAMLVGGGLWLTNPGDAEVAGGDVAQAGTNTDTGAEAPPKDPSTEEPPLAPEPSTEPPAAADDPDAEGPPAADDPDAEEPPAADDPDASGPDAPADPVPFQARRGLRVVVVAPDGRPVPNAAVGVFQASLQGYGRIPAHLEDGDEEQGVRSSRTDAAGVVGFSDLPPSSYVVLARKELRAGRSTQVEVRSDARTDVRIVLDERLATGNLTIRLSHQGRPATGSWSVTVGRLTHTRLCREGVIVERDLQPGTTTLQMHQQYLPPGARRVAPVRQQVEVPVGEATVDIELSEGRTLRGRVVAPRDTPLARGRVSASLSPHSGPFSGASLNAQGEFSLPLIPDTGTVSLRLEVPGYVGVSLHDVAVDSRPKLTLPSGPVHVIEVCDAQGVAVVDAPVFVDTPRRFVVAYGVTDARGEVRLVGSLPGKCTVRTEVQSPRPARASVERVLKGNTRTRLTLVADPEPQVEREATIEGTVVDTTGRPIQGVKIWVHGFINLVPFEELHPNIRNPEARTDAQGRFAIENVKVGKVPLQADHADYARQDAPVVLPADGLQGVRISMQRGVKLSGRVAGHERASKTLWATGPAGAGRDLHVTLGPDGSFDFGQAQLGTWKLAIRRKKPGSKRFRLWRKTVELVEGVDPDLVLDVTQD